MEEPSTDNSNGDNPSTDKPSTDNPRTENASTGSSSSDDASARSAAPEIDARKEFLRDAALFHGKLAIDGLRDLILFPATLIAASVDFFTRSEPVGRYFYDVVHFGKQTERWIDLFSAIERAPQTGRPRPSIDAPSFDELVEQFERKLKAERESGEISTAAKRAVERLREAARKAMNGGY